MTTKERSPASASGINETGTNKAAANGGYVASPCTPGSAPYRSNPSRSARPSARYTCRSTRWAGTRLSFSTKKVAAHNPKSHQA